MGLAVSSFRHASGAAAWPRAGHTAGHVGRSGPCKLRWVWVKSKNHQETVGFQMVSVHVGYGSKVYSRQDMDPRLQSMFPFTRGSYFGTSV